MAPPKIGPVSAEELTFALAVGSAAAAGKIPQSGVKGMGINIADDGDVSRLELTDIPINRAAIAVRGQFPREAFRPIMMRLFALGEAMRDERMTPYVRDADDGSGAIEMHEAVVEIAAVMPLNRKGNFNLATFSKRGAKRAAELDQQA